MRIGKRGAVIALAVAGVTITCTSASATQLVYDGFDYTVGQALGGTGSNAAQGQVNPMTETRWEARSLGGQTYTDATNGTNTKDAHIIDVNLSYPGLPAGTGKAVSYGVTATTGSLPFHDAIAIPSPGGAGYTSGSIYYSFIVKFNGQLNTTARTAFATLASDTVADDGSTAGTPQTMYQSTGTVPMPAGAWIRTAGAIPKYQLGSGKSQSDGLGTSASAPSWQADTAKVGTTQHGNYRGTTATGLAQTDSNGQTFFMVLKYTFVGSNGAGGATADDTVSLWVNPAPVTLGDAVNGETNASTDPDNPNVLIPGSGSYYSAVNADVTGLLDVSVIKSFSLLSHISTANASIPVIFDELRIGTTWADVTPEPASTAALGLMASALLVRRRKRQ
jgi:hypothetical protein